MGPFPSPCGQRRTLVRLMERLLFFQLLQRNVFRFGVHVFLFPPFRRSRRSVCAGPLYFSQLMVDLPANGNLPSLPLHSSRRSLEVTLGERLFLRERLEVVLFFFFFLFCFFLASHEGGFFSAGRRRPLFFFQDSETLKLVVPSLP